MPAAALSEQVAVPPFYFHSRQTIEKGRERKSAMPSLGALPRHPAVACVDAAGNGNPWGTVD
jgi:hypothetical protein